MIGFDQTATVYTPHPTTGAYTVSAKTGLACRLAHRGTRSGVTDMNPEREDIGSARRLMWQDSYVMPETAQVEVNGERWNVVQGSYSPMYGPGGSVWYFRCEVEKAP